jgi:hypothetical protein
MEVPFMLPDSWCLRKLPDSESRFSKMIENSLAAVSFALLSLTALRA